MEDHKLQCLEMSLKDLKWHIIGLSEVRRKGESLLELKSGNLFYYYGVKQGIHGVGFLINTHVKKYVTNICHTSERVICLDLKINRITYTFIQVYAPANKDTQDIEVQRCLKDIEDTYWSSKSDYKYIMGDFNSQVGKRKSGEEYYMGQYFYGKRNSRGEQLIELVQSLNLKIGNTFFKCKPNRRWTWNHPNKTDKTQIDYFLIPNKTNIHNISTIRQIPFDSDHRPMKMILKIPQRRRRCNKTSKSFKIDINKPIPVITNKQAEALMAKLDTEDTIQTQYDKLENALKLAMEEAATDKQRQYFR